VTGRIGLPPAAAADPQVLLPGELLARRELGGRRGRPGIEPRGAQRGQAGGDLEKIAPAHAGGAQALGQQVELRIGDRGSVHGGLLG